jgi:hypothetical protein
MILEIRVSETKNPTIQSGSHVKHRGRFHTDSLGGAWLNRISLGFLASSEAKTEKPEAE